jgi:acetyltransferase-like isoleucine patch superfamily enzyme
LPLGLERRYLHIQVAMAVTFVTSALAFIPSFGYVGAGLAVLLAHSVGLVAGDVTARRRGVNVQFFSRAIKQMCAAAACVAVAVVVAKWLLPRPLVLPVSVVITPAIYIGILHMVDNKLVAEGRVFVRAALVSKGAKSKCAPRVRLWRCYKYNTSLTKIMSPVDAPASHAGRARYEKYRSAIQLVASLFRFVPVKVCLFLWALSDLSYGHLGALVRYCVLKKLAKRCGEPVFIGRGCTIRYWENLEVGNFVSINEQCHIEAAGGITIGDKVSIAHHVSLLSANHGWLDESMAIRDNPITLEPIAIANDVWIGSGCQILAGVVIGTRSIIAAGAVVNKAVSSRTMVGGVPARAIKSLE